MSRIENQSAAQNQGDGSSGGFHGNQRGVGSLSSAELYDVVDGGMAGSLSVDFSGLIAETEASMRGKLSQLRLPDSFHALNTFSKEPEHPKPAGRDEECQPHVKQVMQPPSKGDETKDVSHCPSENRSMAKCVTVPAQQRATTLTDEHVISNTPCPKQMETVKSNVTNFDNPESLIENSSKNTTDNETIAKPTTSAIDSQNESSRKGDGEEEMEVECEGQTVKQNVEECDANIDKDNQKVNRGDGRTASELDVNNEKKKIAVSDLPCVDNDLLGLNVGKGEAARNEDTQVNDIATDVHKMHVPVPKASVLTKMNKNLETLASMYINGSQDIDCNKQPSSSETGDDCLILECENANEHEITKDKETESKGDDLKDVDQADLGDRDISDSCEISKEKSEVNANLQTTEKKKDNINELKTVHDNVEDCSTDTENSLVITNVISLADIEDENAPDVEKTVIDASGGTCTGTDGNTGNRSEEMDEATNKTHANKGELSQDSSQEMETDEPSCNVATNEKRNPTQISPEMTKSSENNTTLSQLLSQTKSSVHTEKSSTSTALSSASSSAMTTISSGDRGLQKIGSSTHTSPVPQSASTDSSAHQVQISFSFKDLHKPDEPVTVKSEPPDDGAYGSAQHNSQPLRNMPSNAKNLSKNGSVTVQNARQLNSDSVSNAGNAVVRKSSVTIHSARKLLTNAVSNATKDIQKLMMTKVSTPVARQMVAAASLSAQKTPLRVITLMSSDPQSAATSTRVIMPKPNTSTVSSNSVPVLKPPSATEVSANDSDASSSDRLQTINIHSVGVAKVTELIARKNPIQPFKSPLHVKNGACVKYVCHECGDVFQFEKSLEIHKGRCSMKLKYHCESCTSDLLFTNKCQFLGHLRSHMNIVKTQAVPIHIKSDSIEITSYFDEIKQGQDFDWYKLKSKYVCPFCPEKDPVTFETQEQLSAHFRTPNNINSKELFCARCCVGSYSNCGLKAHVDVHALAEENDVSQLSPTLICPECAKSFRPKCSKMTINEMIVVREQFAMHLNKCYLPSVMKETYRCSKCLSRCNMNEGAALKHLCANVEKYYKCQLCPMALKTAKSLNDHAKNEHKGNEKSKLIYRCHICATVIDDHKYLVNHLNSHLGEMKGDNNGSFCVYCGVKYVQKGESVRHLEKHKRTPICDIKFCKFCGELCSAQRLLLKHVLTFHMKRSSAKTIDLDKVLCNKCGCFQPKPDHKCIGFGKSNSDHPNPESLRNGSTAESEKSSKDFQPIVCKLCNICLLNSQAMKQHVMTLHPGKFFCQQCHKLNFGNFHEYRSHEIVCTAMKKSPSIEPLVIPKPKEIVPAQKSSNEKQKFFEEEIEIKLTPAVTTGLGKHDEKETLYSCDKCSLKFSRKSKLDEHMNSDHGIHPCHLCGKMYGSTRSVKRHLMMDHEGKRLQYPCLICRKKKIEKSFAIKSMLFKHLRAKHKVKDIDESKMVAELPGLPDVACDQLDDKERGYTSTESTPEPPFKKLRVDGENCFKCAKCLFSSEDKAVFKRHIEDHKTLNTFQCLECGLCFSVIPSLEKHLFMVHKVRNFQQYAKENKIENPADLVDVDDEIEREPARMDVEEESESDAEEKNPLECRVCYREFDSEAQLRGHMRVHGMAFIKRSRRRSQGPSPVKKVTESDDRNCELAAQGESLVLKITKKPSQGVEHSVAESGLAVKAESGLAVKESVGVSEVETKPGEM